MDLILLSTEWCYNQMALALHFPAFILSTFWSIVLRHHLFSFCFPESVSLRDSFHFLWTWPLSSYSFSFLSSDTGSLFSRLLRGICGYSDFVTLSVTPLSLMDPLHFLRTLLLHSHFGEFLVIPLSILSHWWSYGVYSLSETVHHGIFMSSEFFRVFRLFNLILLNPLFSLFVIWTILPMNSSIERLFIDWTQGRWLWPILTVLLFCWFADWLNMDPFDAYWMSSECGHWSV